MFDQIFKRETLKPTGGMWLFVPNGHEAQQSPAGVVNLRCAALDVTTLLARLKVLPPASVRHLMVQQELTGFLNLHTYFSGKVHTHTHKHTMLKLSMKAVRKSRVESEVNH